MKGPDIIVTVSDRIAIFEPQNQRAVDWLRNRCGIEIENPLDQVQLDSTQSSEVVAALRAEGFTVWH